MLVHGGSGGSFAPAHGGSGGSFGSSVPPVGTSAYKAYQAAIRKDPASSARPWSFSPASSSGSPLYSSALGNTALGVTSKPSSATGSGRGSGYGSDSGSQPEDFDYLDAPWASAYQMSKETAYNEAMTNTEYRRAVKDMQAAGLNPAVIFGAGKGSTAGVPGYISSSDGGGGGGGGSYGRRSGGKQNSYLFSGSAYSLISALGGIVGAVATKSAGGYWIGTSLAQGAMHAASGLSNWLKR